MKKKKQRDPADRAAYVSPGAGIYGAMTFTVNSVDVVLPESGVAFT
jgi:hypothetical protein